MLPSVSKAGGVGSGRSPKIDVAPATLTPLAPPQIGRSGGGITDLPPGPHERHLPVGAPRDPAVGDLTAGAAGLRLGKLPPSIRAVSLRETFATDPDRADQLLTKYFESYEAFFPDPDEREPFDVVRSYLLEPGSHWDILLLESRGEVAGGCHWNALDTGGHGTWGVIEHVWLTESSRAKNLFRAALEDVATRLTSEHDGALGIVGEVNDPRLMTKNEIAEDRENSVDPGLRERLWGSNGVKKFDAPYIQPKMDADGSPVEYLSFAVFPFDDSLKSISGEAFLAIARTYFESFGYHKDEGIDVRGLDVFQRMQDATPDKVRLLRMSERRTNAQARSDV